jgi:hypothetical protein
MNTSAMYVLVRNDLSNSYKFIQGTHALSKYSLTHPLNFKKWNNHKIVFLGVRNLKELRSFEEMIKSNRITFSSFHEEDIDNQITSIACYCTGELFKNLKIA